MDILSATGTSCLAFLVLPHTQDVIEACMIIMAVGVVPGILKPFSYRTGDGIRRLIIIISYHIISYHIISYHIISYHIISYHIISYHIISYHTGHATALESYSLSYHII